MNKNRRKEKKEVGSSHQFFNRFYFNFYRVSFPWVCVPLSLQIEIPHPSISHPLHINLSQSRGLPHSGGGLVYQVITTAYRFVKCNKHREAKNSGKKGWLFKKAQKGRGSQLF